MNFYRYTIGCYHGSKKGMGNITDQDLLFQYNIMSPETMLRIARLSLFARIMEKAPAILTRLVMDLSEIAVGWPRQVGDDLRWLCGSAIFNSEAARPFKEWGEYVATRGKYFRGQVKKYAKLRYANTYCPLLPDAFVPLSTLCCSVEGCPFTAGTKQQLAVHMFKIHNMKSVWKIYVGDLFVCPICLKYFHTRERVLNHVRYRSEVCRHNLVLRDVKWTEQQVMDFDTCDSVGHKEAQATGKRRHRVEAPVVQLEGPLQPILLLGNASSHHSLGVGHRHC